MNLFGEHADARCNKEARRLYAELCEAILKFFILLIWNDPDGQAPYTSTPIFFGVDECYLLGLFLKSSIPMFNVSRGWSYSHSRWSVSRHNTHGGCPLCWSSFTGALILVPYGQCVTQVARCDIVIIVK